MLHPFTGNPGNRVFTKATIVKDSKNVTIAHKAEVHHHHETENKKERDNFKGRIKNFPGVLLIYSNKYLFVILTGKKLWEIVVTSIKTLWSVF